MLDSSAVQETDGPGCIGYKLYLELLTVTQGAFCILLVWENIGAFEPRHQGNLSLEQIAVQINLCNSRNDCAQK